MPEKKKPVVPRLRFPEFRDAGPWEVKRLGEIAVRVTYRNSARNESRVLTNSAEFGIVEQRDFFDKDIAVKHNLINYTIVEENDFVYNPRISATAPVGPISRNKIGRGVVSPLYTVFRFQGGYLTFFEYFFQSDAWHPYMRKVGSSGARHDRLSVSSRDLMAMPIPFAEPREQQRIGDCLSSLDEVIELQAQKLDALKAHKKGLLQQLFPRKGETTPRLRFPEFRDAGPWEVKRLGELVETVTPPKKLQTTEYLPSGPYPIIDQSFADVCGWTDDETALVKGNFPLVIFGDHTCVVKLAEGPFAQGADGIKILTPTSEVVARFLFHALQANPIEQKGYKRHFSILKEKPISFPRKDTGEQQKIAECLSSLDEVIELETRRLEALKAHKKGLLQQLFPQEVD